jgi:hypothetical protein
LLACAALGVANGWWGSQAAAGDGEWVFRRSYFSHVLPEDLQARYPQPESRSAYRLPFAYEAPGAGIHGVYRYNNIQIFDGRSMDTTIYRQNWFQLQP